ncbi:hypothetical protein Y027_4907 [Burkholderia pseudomallei TSV5]|nr:hypothetical protein Y027_4907 [Burkholderia pseudomallei TSV5]
MNRANAKAMHISCDKCWHCFAKCVTSSYEPRVFHRATVKVSSTGAPNAMPASDSRADA